MTERTRKRIVYLVFLAALIYGAFNFLGPHRSKVTPTGTNEALATIQPLQTAGTISTASADTTEWGRDPFVQPAKSKQVVSRMERLTLSAISGSPANPLAVINGKILGIGESISGWQIKRISPRSVQLQRNGQNRTLSIGGN
jgi:hypothetical protein